MAVTTKPDAPAIAAADDRDARIPLNAVKLAEHHRRHHWVKLEPGVTVEAIRYPATWANTYKKFQRHDLITILTNDESQEVEACVEKVTRDGVTLSVRKIHKREPINHAGQMLEDGIQTQCIDGWWCVVRLKDGHPIISGHATEASAITQFRREQPRKAA